MPANQLDEARFERGGVERAAQAENERDVVRRVAWFEAIEEPQTLLRVRHGQRSGARGRRDRVGRTRVAVKRRFDALRHRRNRRGFEQAAQRHLDVERLPHPRHDARRQQRVAAELEEVVVDAEVLDAEHFGLRPDLAEQILDGRSRRLVGVGVAACFDVGERLAIDFAVDRQRQLVEHGIRRRHFVLGQRPTEKCTQRRRVRQRTGRRRHIRDQPRAPLPMLDDDRGLCHVGVRGERGFDLAELDAIAANLHLIVEPAEIVDGPVRAIPRAIAGAVQACAFRPGERIRHEAFGGQIGPRVIAARDARAADENLAGDAHRNLREIRVEQVHLQVGDRTADRHRVERIVFRRVVHAAADDGFRRSVFVDQPGARRVLAPECQRRSVERLAADDERMRATCEIAIGEPLFEDFEMRGRQLEQAQAVAVAQHARQFVDVRARRDQRHRPAGDQREIETRDGQIETQRRVHRRSAAVSDFVIRRRPLEVVRKAAVRDHRTLRQTGRSRCVDQIRDLLRHDRHRRIRRWLPRDLRPVAIEMDDADVCDGGADASTLVLSRVEGGARAGPSVRPGEQNLDLRVLGHVLEAFRRVARIERHVRAAGFQHTEQRDDHVDRTLD